MCCVLVLTVYELGGATANVVYKFDSKKDVNDTLHIMFRVIPGDVFDEDSISLNFTVESLNQAALNIPTTNIPTLKIKKKIVENEYGNSNEYLGSFDVSVTAHTDGVLTGDLSATLSCDHDLCKDSDNNVVETEVVIVQETKSECVH